MPKHWIELSEFTHTQTQCKAVNDTLLCFTLLTMKMPVLLLDFAMLSNAAAE